MVGSSGLWAPTDKLGMTELPHRRGRPTLVPQTEKQLLRIIRRAGEYQDSLESLAAKTGRSRSLIRSTLGALVKKGIIAVVPTRPKKYIYLGNGEKLKNPPLRQQVIEIEPGTELIIRIKGAD